MKHLTTLIIVLIVTVLAMTALSCSNFSYQNGTASIDLSLNISKLNSIVSGIGGKDSDFIGKIDKIELIEPNIMRITGDFRMENGKVEPGSIDFAFAARNGALAVQVVQVDISGLSLDSPVIIKFNDTLGKAFNVEVANSNNNQSGVSDVQVKNNKLVISVKIRVKGND